MSIEAPQPTDYAKALEVTERKIGQPIYDATRSLFDVSKPGITVGYVPGETSRPHESERLITAKIAITPDDHIVIGDHNHEIYSPWLAVALRIFPDYPHGRENAGSISITLADPLNVPVVSGILKPDGSVVPENTNDSQALRYRQTTMVHSAFALFMNALSENRLHRDFTVNPVRRTTETDFAINPTLRVDPTESIPRITFTPRRQQDFEVDPQRRIEIKAVKRPQK